MMEISTNAFKEPRGVMRLLHLLFSICAFATVVDFSGDVTFTCPQTSPSPHKHNKKIYYPFDLQIDDNNCHIYANFSSDSEFFVAVGVLAMIYSIIISLVHLLFDDMYKSKSQLPLIDFIITVIFGVLWLSSSAAWSNAVSGLKYVTSAEPTTLCNCSISNNGYGSLNISIILGFLNFFIWAADLWFLYKETTWFQGNQQQQAAASGV